MVLVFAILDNEQSFDLSVYADGGVAWLCTLAPSGI